MHIKINTCINNCYFECSRLQGLGMKLGVFLDDLYEGSRPVLNVKLNQTRDLIIGS